MKNSFNEITESLLENKDLNRLNDEVHHGITRMEHTMRVAKYTYKISKGMNFDYVSATRAAVLHDFFFDSEYDSNNIKGIKKGVIHPELSLNNAMKNFDLNDIEKNAIISHMFPLRKTLPKYKESWVVSIVDKSVALYELLAYKFRYKLVNSCSLGILFAFNIITMKR